MTKKEGKKLSKKQPAKLIELLRHESEEINLALQKTKIEGNVDISAEVYVSSERKVKAAGSDEEKSLTQLTKEILELDYNIQPTRYWSYEGKSLNAYYNETYTFVD